MKNFIIAGSLDPRDFNIFKLIPKISRMSWPVKDKKNGGFYDVEYLDIEWLGLQIRLDNERD